MKSKYVQTVFGSIVSTMALCIVANIDVTSIYPAIILVLVTFAFTKIKNRKSTSAIILSLLFTVFIILGKYKIIYEQSNIMVFIIKIAVIFVGMFLLFKKIVIFLYYDFINVKLIRKNKNIRVVNFFIISFILIFICYFICWLAEYPGPLSPDTINQFNQIRNGAYTNHHPFAHTMYLKLLMSFGQNHLESMGIASLIQLILNSIAFSYISTYIYRKSKNLIIGIITVLFYSLISYQAFYSITLFKDTTHAVITVLLLVFMFEYLESRKKIYLVLIVIFSIAFCLFRSNGYFAFIPFVIFAIILFIKKKNKILTICVIGAFIIATIIKGPVYTALGVSKASFIEPLSIPLQQVSLVIKNERELDEKSKWLTEELMDTNKIGEEYNPILSDPMKKLVNTKGNEVFFKEHLVDYIKMYIKLGFTYPGDYLMAWINQTSGFFYPAGYYQNFFTGVWKNDLGIEKASKLNTDVVNTIEDLSYNQHNYLLVGIFNNPACIAWIMLLIYFFFIDKKQIDIIFVLTPLVMMWLTLLVSVPFNMEFRYMYSVTCCLPVLCVLPFIYRKEQ